MQMSEHVGSEFSGELEGISLVDLVQFACLEGGSRKLTVQHDKENGLV